MLNDIIMLQVTWLYNDEMSVLSNIHTDFCGYGISSMNTALTLVSGRPYGGIGILWRKSLDKSGVVVKYENESRILGLEVRDNAGCRHLFLNVCFLYEHSNYYDEYMKLCNNIDNCESPYVYILGEFKLNVLRINSVFADKLKK